MYTTVIFQRVHIIFQQLHHCHYISMCIAVQIYFSIYTCVIIFLNVHQHYILAHTLVSLFSALHQYFRMYYSGIIFHYVQSLITFQHVHKRHCYLVYTTISYISARRLDTILQCNYMSVCATV